MADLTFNTPSGETVARELLVAYLNTAVASSTSTTPTPVWSPVGKRVEDSSLNYDWSLNSKTDIFGNVYTTGKKPVRKQTFEPCELDSGDVAQLKLWNLAVRDGNVSALTNLDMLIVHLYAGTAGTAVFAERYSSCAILPSSLGGEGGGAIGMPIEVTYGGTRTTGTAAKDASTGAITFTADT